jgi:hypothetical protein
MPREISGTISLENVESGWYRKRKRCRKRRYLAIVRYVIVHKGVVGSVAFVAIATLG